MTAPQMMALSDAFNAAYQALLKTWGNATASEEQEQDKKLLNQQIGLLKNGIKTSSGHSAGPQLLTTAVEFCDKYGLPNEAVRLRGAMMEVFRYASKEPICRLRAAIATGHLDQSTLKKMHAIQQLLKRCERNKSAGITEAKLPEDNCLLGWAAVVVTDEASFAKELGRVVEANEGGIWPECHGGDHTEAESMLSEILSRIRVYQEDSSRRWRFVKDAMEAGQRVATEAEALPGGAGAAVHRGAAAGGAAAAAAAAGKSTTGNGMTAPQAATPQQEHATLFCAEVRRVYGVVSQTYKGFTQTMNNYAQKDKDTLGTIRAIKNLFADHPSLIVDFAEFVSPSFKKYCVVEKTAVRLRGAMMEVGGVTAQPAASSAALPLMPSLLLPSIGDTSSTSSTVKKRPREETREGTAPQNSSEHERPRICNLTQDQVVEFFPFKTSEVLVRCGQRQAGGGGEGSSTLNVRAGESFDVVVTIKSRFGPAAGQLVEEMMQEIVILPAREVELQGEPHFSTATAVATFRVSIRKAGNLEISAAVRYKGDHYTIGGRGVVIKVGPGALKLKQLLVKEEAELGEEVELVVVPDSTDLFGNECQLPLGKSLLSSFGADLRLEGGWSHDGHVPVPLQLMQPSLTKNEDGVLVCVLNLRLLGLHTFQIRYSTQELTAQVRIVGGIPHSLRYEAYQPHALLLRRWGCKAQVLNGARYRGQEMKIREQDLTAKLVDTSGLNLPLKVRSTLRSESVQGCSLANHATQTWVTDLEMSLIETDPPVSRGTYQLYVSLNETTLTCEPCEIRLDAPIDPAMWSSQEVAESLRQAGFEVPGDVVKDEFGTELNGENLIGKVHEKWVTLYETMRDCRVQGRRFPDKAAKDLFEGRIKEYIKSLNERHTDFALGKGKYQSSAKWECDREDVQEGYGGEEESEVDKALEAGGRGSEGSTRGQESRMRENSKEHLGSQEMQPFNAGSPAPSHIGACRTTFPFAVAESPKIGEAGGEVSEPKRTSKGRAKRVATLRSYPGMSSLTAAEGDKRGLNVISRDVMRSEPAAGDKRSALDAPDTDDDDGCAEQGEGAGAAGPKPEQSGTRNKKLRRDGEAHSSY